MVTCPRLLDTPSETDEVTIVADGGSSVAQRDVSRATWGSRKAARDHAALLPEVPESRQIVEQHLTIWRFEKNQRLSDSATLRFCSVNRLQRIL